MKIDHLMQKFRSKNYSFLRLSFAQKLIHFVCISVDLVLNELQALKQHKSNSKKYEFNSFCCIAMLQLLVYIYKYKRKHNDEVQWTNEHTSLEKYNSHTLFSKGSRKGWCWLCMRGELETERDCNILTPSSSDYSSTSSSFSWAAQPGSWGPNPSVWTWFSLLRTATLSSRLWHLVI